MAIPLSVDSGEGSIFCLLGGQVIPGSLGALAAHGQGFLLGGREAQSHPSTRNCLIEWALGLEGWGWGLRVKGVGGNRGAPLLAVTTTSLLLARMPWHYFNFIKNFENWKYLYKENYLIFIKYKLDVKQDLWNLIYHDLCNICILDILFPSLENFKEKWLKCKCYKIIKITIQQRYNNQNSKFLT